MSAVAQAPPRNGWWRERRRRRRDPTVSVPIARLADQHLHPHRGAAAHPSHGQRTTIAPTTAPGRSRRSSPSTDSTDSAGAVDLVVAATAELRGLTLLHRDRDFECLAAVTGQALQWYGPEDGKPWARRRPARATWRSSAVTSQAESASSRLVTRSTTKPAQVMDPGLFVVRCDHSPPSEPVSAP